MHMKNNNKKTLNILTDIKWMQTEKYYIFYFCIHVLSTLELVLIKFSCLTFFNIINHLGIFLKMKSPHLTLQDFMQLLIVKL